MTDLILSYLALTGECPLKGIGRLYIARSNAVCDLSTKEILPPDYKIHFAESGHFNDDALVQYIASASATSVDRAGEVLKRWLNKVNDALNNEGTFDIPSAGSILRQQNGTTTFKGLNVANPYKPVRAERVIHAADSHTMVVGDKISNTAEMNQVLQEPETKRSRYGIAALILLAAAALTITLYYLTDGFGIHLTAPDPPETYQTK